jgi:hypothetical protein
MSLTTLLSPVSARVEWPAQDTAWVYQVLYKPQGASAFIVHARATPGTSTIISNLTPGASYVIEVSWKKLASPALQLVGTATVTLPASAPANFSKPLFRTNSALAVEYDIDAVASTTSAIGEAELAKGIFSTGDILTLKGAGYSSDSSAQFVNVSGTAAVSRNASFYVPFEASGETVTLATSSGNVAAVYDAANKSIAVNAVQYADGDSLSLGGQRVKVAIR